MTIGLESKPLNIIEKNLIWNTGAQGIQAAADANIRNNCVANAGAAGIYSRDHQQAATGNLTIRDNVVTGSRAEAIRIQRPTNASGDADYSGPVEIVGNVLVGKKNQRVVRAEPSSRLSFRTNVGIGQIEGIRPQEKDWQPLTDDEIELPKLEGNPAWKHLDRTAVRARFSVADR